MKWHQIEDPQSDLYTEEHVYYADGDFDPTRVSGIYDGVVEVRAYPNTLPVRATVWPEGIFPGIFLGDFLTVEEAKAAVEKALAPAPEVRYQHEMNGGEYVARPTENDNGN